MNFVRFPGLGLKFGISRIAFQIGNIVFYKYSVCIFLGIIFGLILAKISRKKFGIKFDTVLDILIGGIIFGIIGARTYFILFKLDYYLENPSQILKIRDGGIAIYGAIIGIVTFVLIYCKIKKINFWI